MKRQQNPQPLSPELIAISRKKKKWENVIKVYESRPAHYFEPRTQKDLVRIIQYAESKGLTVRAVGAGHSYSDVAQTDGCLVNPKFLDKISRIDETQIKSGIFTQHFVEVECGITLKDLNSQLDKVYDLALPNMGTIDKQTISGAVSTSTHGTGIGLPPISDIVRSMVLVTHGGNIYRIEPTDGITNPQTYTDEDITLIQDDDWFYSAVVSMGSMGLVYSYILEVEPMYGLEESKESTKWSVIRQSILEQTIHEGYRHVSIQINPYEINGDHTCTVIRQKKVELKAGHRSFPDRTRNIIPAIMSHSRVLANLSRWMLNQWPDYSPKLIEGVLKNSKDKKFVSKSYKVLHQGAARIKHMGCDCEFAFDYEKKDVIFAVEKIFGLAKQLGENPGIYQSTFIVIRFVKGSTAYLSAMHGNDRYMMDLPVVMKVNGAFQILDTYQDAMIDFGARPHWGKINTKLSGKIELIRSLYPKLDDWLKVYRTLNPNGTFDNVFTRRMGFAGNAVEARFIATHGKAESR